MFRSYHIACADLEGDRGSAPSPHPLEIHKAIMIWIPWNFTSYQASIKCWAIIGPPAKRHSNGVSLMGRWWLTFSLSPHQLKTNSRQSWVRPPLTKLFGSMHALVSSHSLNCYTHLLSMARSLAFGSYFPTLYVQTVKALTILYVTTVSSENPFLGP